MRTGRTLRDRRSLNLALIAFAVLAMSVAVSTAQAQDANHAIAGTKIVMVNGALTFPTGRFAETIEDQNAFKAGHNSGKAVGAEAGLFVGERVAVGVGYDYTEFGLDFGSLSALYPTKTAHSTLPGVQVWGRFFPVGGYAHWRPYVAVGVGMARWRGTVEYTNPIPGDSLETIKTVTTVDPRLALTGGAGVMIPVHPNFVVNIEGRYRRVSTKGASRDEEWTTLSGEVFEFQYPVDDPEGRRYAKSNTNWWEVRFGVALAIP